MPQISVPNFSLSKLATWVGALGVIIGGVFAFDARYNTGPAIESLRAEVVNEIAINRSAMISMMQSDAGQSVHVLCEQTWLLLAF